MKIYLRIILIISFLFVKAVSAQKQSDQAQIDQIVKHIEALQGDAYQIATYFSELDHQYLERFGQTLFPYIKKEYDNLKVNKELPLDLQFEVTFLLKNAYYVFGEHRKAADLSYEMLSMAKQLNDSLYYYYAYSSIADIETEVGNNESSLEFLLKAQKYAVIDTASLAQTYIDLAALYSADDELQLVKKNVTRGIELAKQADDYFQVSYGYSMLMNYYMASNQLNEALKTYQIVDSIIQNYHFLETSRVAANVTVYAASVYKQLGNYEKSSEFYQRAFSQAKESSDKYNLAYIYKEWSELEELKGNYKKSLALFKQHALVEDTLFSENSIAQINNLKALHDLENKEHEIQVAKQEQQNTKRQLWLFLIIGIVFVSALTLLVFFLRSRLKAEKLKAQLNEKQSKLSKIEVENLEREVELKNKKLADLFLHQYEKAYMLNNVIESVDHSSETVINTIQLHQNKKKDWDNFKAHFDQVHEGFFDKLNALSPDLTPKDIRLCAYIRMNLSSKEIAIMLGISHRTVQGIKSRVRKKINLSSKEDLVKFLMNL